MRKKMICCVLYAFVFIWISLFNVVDAEASTAWDEIINNSNIKKISTDKDILKISESDITFKSNIESFDVDENRIVIAFKDGTLGIFDKGMKIIKSYKCYTAGVICGVVFKGKNIVLFYTRLRYAIEITQSGQVVAIYDVPDESDTRRYAYLNTCRDGDSQYYVSYNKNKPDVDAWWTDEPYLIREDKYGKTSILYDTYSYDKKRKIKIRLAFAAWVLVIGIIFFLILYNGYRRKMKGNIKDSRTEWEIEKDELIRTVTMINESSSTDNPLMSSTKSIFDKIDLNKNKSCIKPENCKDRVLESKTKTHNPFDNFKRK